MNIILLIGFLLSSALAAPRIVILTSLNEIRLERKVTRYVEKNLADFDVELKHKATQDELYEAILSGPDGLIWLSHGSEKQTLTGLGVSPQILDFHKDDISPLFQVLSSKTQFLSVVSCFAKEALDFQKVSTSRLAGFYFPNKRTVAMNGFKKALTALKKTNFQTIPLSTSKNQDQLSVIIKRKNGNSISLKVFNQQRFLGLIKDGESIDFSVKDVNKNLRFEYPRYSETPNDNDWGDLDLLTERGGFHLFTDKQGRPFGSFSRVFLYKE